MRCLWYVIAALAVTTAGSAAQSPAAGSPAQGAAPGSSTQAAASPASPRYSLSQFVLFSDGYPVRGATVIVSLSGAGSAAQTRVATTDSVGHFTIDSLLAGSYRLQVLVPGSARQQVKTVTVDGKNIGYILVSSEPTVLWGLLFLVIYIGTIILARWHNIARSLDEMLKGQLSALRTRLVTEVDPTRSAERTRLQTTIDQIEQDFTRGPKLAWWRPRFAPSEVLFWSRGRENAAWVAIHEVERQLAAFLAPPERVVSYMHLTHAQLRVINSPHAIAIADAIRAALPSQPDEPTTPAQDEKRKALLSRAIAITYEERDKQFATLMEWHNKASWLIGGALLIIGFLALAAGHAILFLAGAAGGFLSRVMRALRREDIPLDYGASWTTLFLSPLFGALAGWFGVAIITLATQPNVNLLGDAFKLVDWYTPTGPTTLAAAFLLGFSERFFDAVVGAVERHAAGTKAAEQAAKAAEAAAPPIVQRAGAGDGSGTAAAPAPSSAGGVKIELAHGPLPIQTVSGKVVLENPATADTGITLSVSRADFLATPAALTISAGKAEATFDIVPPGNATAGAVRVTARVGNVVVSDSIDFIART
jgi:hypothetical protein